MQQQNDEVQRHQKANEDATARINLIQKRVDERESRLRKIEQENVIFVFVEIAILLLFYLQNELLDEIHNLRKRNHEIESNLDIMKQHILDKDDIIIPSTSRSSSVMDMGYYSQVIKIKIQFSHQLFNLGFIILPLFV